MALRSLACVVLLSATAAATADVTFFTDPVVFETAASAAGLSPAGFEDFEEARLDPGELGPITDPLDQFTDDEFFLPGEIVPGLQIQSNVGGEDDSEPNPRGYYGLAVANEAYDAPSRWVVTNNFFQSHDLIFPATDRPLHGVAFALLSIPDTSVVRLHVFDLQNVLIGESFLTVTSGTFAGVVSAAPIGRINLWSMTNRAEGADNIELWTAPGTLAIPADQAGVFGGGTRQGRLATP